MKTLVLVTLLLSALTMPAFAYDWIMNPANNHLYTLIDNAVSWQDAENKAISIGAHLVSITSQEENEWVKYTFSPFDFMWIGLWQPDHNNPSYPRVFVWTSGEQFIYTNWAPGDPNELSNEPYVAMEGYSEYYHLYDYGKWVDLSSQWPNRRHIAVAEIAPIPEPSSLLSLCGGFAGLGFLKRRRA